MLLLFKDHDKWIKMVISFGCNKTTAQDLVSEMYIKIQKRVEAGMPLMFDEKTLNYYYIFRTLNSLFIDLKRKEKNIILVDLADIDRQKIKLNPLAWKRLEAKPPDYDGKYKIIKAALNSLYWYDRKVYEIIEGGESLAALSKKTNISYYSLYNTFTKVKKYLKNLIQE